MIKGRYAQTKTEDDPRCAGPSFAQDIFPINAINDSGIFALPGGRYSKSFVLGDINFAGASDEEQRDMITMYSRVLKSIGCRFSISVSNEYVDDAIFREKITYKAAGDKDDKLRDEFNRVISDKVTDARQGLYSHIYLTLTIKASGMKDAVSTFTYVENSVRTSFQNMGSGSSMRALSIDERIGVLYNFMHTGLGRGKGFCYSSMIRGGLDFLNVLSPACIEFENEYFYLNGCVGKVMYMDEYPKSLESDIIAELSRLNCTCFVTMNNELLEKGVLKQEALKQYMALGIRIENEKQQNRSRNDFLTDASQKLLDQKERLEQFLRELDEKDDKYYNTTIMVTVLAKSKKELRKIEEKLAGTAGAKSFTLGSCFARQLSGLNSSLIYGVQEFKRPVNLSSGCLAMFIPYKSQEINDKGGIWYGINQLTGNIILVNKKKLKNHNCLILGQSGSGKSVFSKCEILSIFLCFPDDQVLIVDPQSEYGKIVSMMHGTVICFDTDKNYYINPLDVDFEGVDHAGLRQVIARKADFLITLISALLRRNLMPEEQGVIDRVADRVYSANFAMRKRLGGNGGRQSAYEVPGFMKDESATVSFSEKLSREEQIRAYSPILQDIYQGLMDEGTMISTSLAVALEIFVNGSLNLFNHRTNVDMSNRIISFDLSGLKDNLRTASMLIMMETLNDRIRSNGRTGRWTHLFIDEFHELLSMEQVAAFVLKLWKEVRKQSGILSGITQNMTDLLNEEGSIKLSAILSNTECFALLSQSSTDKAILKDFLPGISHAMLDRLDDAPRGTGILKMGSVCIPFDMRMGTDTEIYRIVNTDGGAKDDGV